MNKPKVQILADGYRLMVGETVSEVHDFGEPIELKVPTAMVETVYIAMLDIPEGVEESNEIEYMLEHLVYVAVPVEADIEEVDETPITQIQPATPITTASIRNKFGTKVSGNRPAVITINDDKETLNTHEQADTNRDPQGSK